MTDVTVYAVPEGAPMTEALAVAVRALDGGALVAVPTDTVYGIVADVSYTGAADRLFALKRRQRDQDLNVAVSDIDQALSLTIGVPESADRLMNKFWPGPITLVLPRHPDFVADLGDDDATVGIRCVDNLVTRLLCEEVGPIAVTTANRQGRRPATTAQEVVEMFGKDIEVVLDGGSCAAPMATVVDCTGADAKLLREGAIAWSEIQASLS